jgi:signal peptidase II
LKKYILPFVVISSVLLLDQWLKYWVHTNIYESHKVMFPNWFLLYYTENNGMAFGVEFGGIAGKLVLTIFRILAVFAIMYYIVKQINLKAPAGFIICVSLILAGAVGNIIDSVFYGVLYRSQNLPLFQGRVIDMLYFPLVDSYLPDWVPVWKGERFQFFRPVFNIADASISTGIVAILLFQKRLFKHHEEEKVEIISEQTSEQDIATVTALNPEVTSPSQEKEEDIAKSVEDDNSLGQNGAEKDTKI